MKSRPANVRRSSAARSGICASAAAIPALLAGSPAAALEPRTYGALRTEPSLEVRLGVQHGTGINFGAGASDARAETNRSSLSASIEPRLGWQWSLATSELYGGLSVAAATTTLDGEIAGNFARSGDTAIDTDEAFVGWRYGQVDISVGAQEFTVGDGLLIADGNFDTGRRDGNYWVAPFGAWRNSAILKLDTSPVHADVFWLHSDRDFGDARLTGVNLETALHPELGKLGVMFFQIFDADGPGLNGRDVWDARMSEVRVPGIVDLLLYGEVVQQVGRDVDTGRDYDGLGWYLEGQYHFPSRPWTPSITFRYAHFSGDDPATPDDETYRGLFYTFYEREWDTWYLGEIASEYHLFNSNQVTKMLKLKAAPRPDWVVSLYYYRHDLDEPQYFGVPVSSTAWADEVNLAVEHFGGDRFYVYAGIAWSTPDTAAREVFGPDDFTVVQTWLSYRF
jgi:hypothetical protein